jgi:probable F420-dependent oxidoreductase
MRIGAVFPQTEIGSDPAAVSTWARAVEDMGYDHLLAFDHVIGAGTAGRPGWQGYTHEQQFHEVFVLFGYLAAVTESLELVTSILILPQRQTALVAKQAAEVDVLSGGRLRLGVGIGWNPVEYEVLGETFTDRGRRSEEQVELLRALWSQPLVTFDGRWHQVVDAGINPLPPRGTIPVWFGGYADATLRRVGRLGDGWLPRRAPDDVARESLERVRGFAREAGRDPAEIGFEPRITLAGTSRDALVPFATGWRGIGATHLCVDTMGLGLASLDDHLAALRDTLGVLRSAVGTSDD